MASLIARTAAHGLLPQSHGTVTLSELDSQITSVAPFAGKDVGTILGDFPAPGRSFQTTTGQTILWSGKGQAFVIGACPSLGDLAATTDQSDAWAHLVLEGGDITGVLARLCPLDLNPSVFKPGHSARSLLGHMNALYYRATPGRIEVFVFRSMAHTAVHEITHAMRRVAAR